MSNNSNRWLAVMTPIGLLTISLLANAWQGSALTQRQRDRQDIDANTIAVSIIRERLGRIEEKIDAIKDRLE